VGQLDHRLERHPGVSVLAKPSATRTCLINQAMRITQVESQVLRVPLLRAIDAPGLKLSPGKLDRLYVLIVQVDTDAGHRGLGLACTIEGGARALRAIAEDDLSHLVIGEDPLDHERLGAKVFGQLLGIARGGLVAQAYAAFDLALWDLKGKAAGLPLYKLLGGAREQSPVYYSDGGWMWMNPEQIVDASREYLDQGMMGIKICVGGSSPEADADRVTRVREALGEDTWLGVDAGQRYDYATALSMGHFFEEEMGVDWFADPVSCDDVESHARLCDKLEVPIAVGGSLESRQEFQDYLGSRAADILQPDVTRIGGLTRWLKIAGLAQLHHRPLAPHVPPQVGVHLACGLPEVRAVEHVPWLEALFSESPAIVDGQIVPSPRPGLGLEIRPETVEKYRISGN
jgi:L-alanine-DL-glutamate epimerase-like enolase superfamily enzyme